jgi:hypothetical protein
LGIYNSAEKNSYNSNNALQSCFQGWSPLNKILIRLLVDLF